MIALLLIVPALFAALLLIVSSRVLASVLLVSYAVLHFALTLALLRSGAAFTRYFRTDDLGLLFLLLLSIVFLCVSVYTLSYFRDVRAVHTAKEYSRAVLFILLFVDSINGVLLSSNLGLLWVFLEASTLTSVALVNFDRKHSSLEAAWKYVFICSIGISLGFIGIVFLSAGSLATASLFFDDLNRASIQLFWLKLSFPFIVVGFGTKMGLAPVHSWLPDAHSEAPAPISALLSGALLNSALFGILRVLKIMQGGGAGVFANRLLAVLGFISLFVSAVFVLGSRNYKRMLAYSSIENMGIISIAVGIGAPFAALLHVIGHSLAKSSFFLTSGNVYHHSHTREIAGARDLFRRDGATAWLWMFSLLAISAIPPFVTFMSEYLVVRGLLARGAIGAVLFLALLVVVVFGMTQAVVRMIAGRDRTGSPSSGIASSRLPFHAYAPQFALLAAAGVIGIWIPGPILSLLRGAVAYLGGIL